MQTFFVAVFAVSSVFTLILSAFRLYLEWKRMKDKAWETSVRLMASDPDAKLRADDFADLFTFLRYLEKHPDCLSEYRTLLDAVQDDRSSKTK